MAELVFDRMAQAYDTDFTASKTGMAQREKVRKLMENIPGKEHMHCLELNCGTGEDALWMAEKGWDVWATDQSENMLEISAKKYAGKNVPGHIRFLPLDLKNPSPGIHQEFDIVFSNFGGLNCISPAEWKKLSLFLEKVTHSGSRLVFVIMPDRCRWEDFYFLIAGKWKKRGRRATSPVDFHGMDIYYYSPAQVVQFLEKSFTPVRHAPVGYYIPPSFMEKWMQRFPAVYRMLYRKEMRTLAPELSGLSDHFYIEFIRR